MPNRNAFLRSPLDRLVDEWERDGGLPPLPEVTQPNASAQAQPNVRAQALPSLEELQRQLDSIAPGRFKVVTGKELTPEPEQPAVSEAEEPATEEQPGIARDVGNLLIRGLTSTAMNLRELISRIPKVGPSIVEALDSVDRFISGKGSEEILRESMEASTKALSTKQREALQKAWWDEEKNTFGPAWGDPRSYLAGVVQSLPETVLTMGAAGRLAKAAYARALAKTGSQQAAATAAARTATVAGGITEGLLGGAGTGREVREEILAMDADVLRQSEAMQALLDNGLSFEEARKQLAEDASTQGFLIAGVATGLFGGMGDRVLANILTGRLTGNIAGRMARGAVAEGVLEELPQSMAQRAAENYAVRQADPSRPLTAGVLNEGLGGLAAGGIMGAGFGALARPSSFDAAQDGAAQDSAVSSPLDQFEADMAGGAEVAVPADDTILQPGQPAVWQSNGQEIPLEVISVNERAPGDDRPHARVRMGENETLVPMEELAPAVEPAPSGPVGRAVQNAMRQAEAAVAEAEAPVEITGSQYATDGLPVRDVGLPGVEAVAPVGLADAGAVAATPGVDAVGRAVPAASGERSGIDLPSTDVAADAQPALSPGLVLRTDGTPFKSEAAARQAAKNRRLQGYEPVEVDGGWALRPTEQPADGDVPHFETYDDANDWIERRAKELGISRRAFSSTDEYKAIYPQIEALYQDQKAKTAEQRMAALRDAGLAVGDRVQTTVPGMFLDGTDYSGTIVLRGGEPWVKVDGKITVSKNGRLREASTVRWDSRWKKQTATAGAPAGAQQSTEAQDGLQEGRQEAQVSEPARVEPALVYRSDGTPFKTEKAARQAMKNRRLAGYRPVQVDGGWALEEVPQHEKPLAGDGLTSYRYRGPHGYVMIGARDHQDALNEARRSLTEGDATIDNLQVWDGNQYVDVTGPGSGDARPEAGVAKAEQAAAAEQSESNKPAAKPKSKAQARKEKDEAQRQRTRDMLGAKEGDIVTPSADIGYSRAGESYRVISIGADGSVDVENVATGSRTQWSRSDLAAATRRGVEFARQEAATGAEAAPAAEQAGQKATPRKRQTAKQGAEPEHPKQEKASEPHPLVGKTVRFVAWGDEKTGVVTGVSDGTVIVRGQGGLHSVEIDRVEVIEEAEARSDKAELTPDDLDRIPFPLEAGYRIVSRPAKGSVVIAPRKIGALYTDDDFKKLAAYGKPFGFTVMRHGEKKGYAYIIAPLTRPYDWMGAFLSDGGVAEAARKQREQEEAEAKRKKEAQKEEEYRNLPSSKWIDENLGTEFTNLHNRLMLARVLDGVDTKFRGLIDRFWLSPLESIGFDLEQHGSDNADVIAFLKRKYAEQRAQLVEEAAAQPSDQETQADLFGGLSAGEVQGEQARIDELRRQLREAEDQVVGRAGMAPGFVEDAMGSRKVPKEMKDRVRGLRQQIREAQARLDAAQKEQSQAAPAPSPAPAATQADAPKTEAAPEAKPKVSKNRIFTDEAAEKARQVLRSKLGQLNSGIDPEIMQAGITLAGYHIEKGARTFAAYAKAMIEDMGEVVRPYLKSWYLGVRFDPRAAEFADDMDSAAAVESFDLDRLDKEPSTERRDPERRGDQAAARDQEREGAERSEPELTETVVTPSGREFEVRLKVVEADSLITSNDDTGRVNPDYPAELQPRDRSRAASEAQINEIASNLAPRLLGRSPSATDGAPIVGPDNVVESGNGRTLAIRRAYQRGRAEHYREWLADQGFDVAGMRAPVLVRERITPMTMEERRAYTLEANERTTLELSATERALADADKVGEIIHLYRGGELDSAQNRDFVRAFADRVLSPADRGNFIDSEGAISANGIRRMQAALVARAYGDEALVTALFESTDNDIRAIGGALLDVSGIWAQMRQESREGVISPLVDVTPNLLEAVRIVRRARSEGRSIAELVGQNDMFAGAIDPTTLYFLGVLYRGENYTRARSRDKVAGALRYYTEQARLTQPTENMFGEPPVSGEEIARHTYERLQREDGQTDQQSDLFARPRADAADAGEAGGGRQRQGAGAASEADSPAAAEGDVDAPSTGESLERDRGQRGAGEPVIRASNEDERRADTASPGRAGEGAGGARRAGQRDRGVSEAGAAARGERSNQPVYQQDGEYESPRGAARDTERGGSRRDSDTGSAVEQERAADIARHAQTPRTGEFAERLAAQRAAKGVATDWGNPESIDAALPLLLPAQREDVLKAERRFAEHTGMLFTNGTGTGKAQPLDAKILTPRGWVRMGDIKVGDDVISVDGTPTKVLGVYPQGKKGIYRVTFDDGSFTECCDEHLWLTQTLQERRKASTNPEWNCAKPKVRQLSEIRATLDKQHFIPVVAPVQLQGDISGNLLPAYTMGVILGDGCLTGGSLTFSTPDDHVAQRVEAELPASIVLVKQESKNRCVSYRLTNAELGTEADGTFSKGVIGAELERLGLLGLDSFGKFIPREYLYAKVEDRIALLQGLMDTDGTVDERTNSAYFTTVSPSLKDGFVELVQSLGGIARVNEKVPTYTYRGERRTGQKAYTITVALPEGIAPFSLDRKARKLRARTWGQVRRKIVSVEYVGEKAAQCIAVEHEAHLYVTDSYIVTHNTFTGLGIAKRFYNDGKRNILVVVPSDKVASDWVKSAGYLDLPLKQLASTADNGGSGPVVTTYANFGQNPTLVDREWDLVIADESHYLMSSEDAEVTHALAMLRALTGHPDGFYTWLTNKYRDLYQQYTAARDDLRNAGRNPDIPQEEYARREARANQLNAQWTELENRERLIWQQRWAEQRDLPRVTFLSATPFAYVKNVEYAEGYLFNYAPPAERFNMRSRGYNEGGPREQFFVQNFGYRMRNNRLTQPEAGVNVEFLERQFNERLKREGALSGRRLEVEHDYQRRFLLVEDAVGQKIDDGLKWLREHEDGRFRPLYDYVQEQFTYHQRMYLLEAIKAKRAIPHIKKHLALGRKVVVFHDFNKGGGFHPFQIPRRPGVKVSIYRDGKRQDVLWDDLVQAFENSRPDLVRLDMTDLHSPIVTMREAFPDALFFNGTISKGERRRNADLFNDDNSGRNIIVVQSDAGREGVSLHDTTGKHQRVMINLGMPTKPVAATQIEGRIYRTGQASDAIFDYITTGTAWEAHAFGTKIAERSSTAENLALGEEARGLKQAFIDAYQNAEFFEPSLEDGRGGKDYDRTMGVSAQVSAFDRAKTYYYAQQKNTKRRDQREGVDYFATPEPVGFKMVEWADVRENDNVLEPSAGHGAIARFVPETARLTMVEPSYDLSQRAALARGDARIINDRFESLHVNNKYDAIVMNPPYGTGGKTAVEHLAKAAQHLRNGGRIVALLPRGGMADQRLNRFLASDEAKNLHTVAEILLPPSTFERAGTKVNSKILVLERQDNADTAAQLEQHHIDLSNVESVGELFDRIEHIELPARLQSAEAEQAPQLEIVEHVTRTGKTIRGVIRTDLTRDQAEAIDPYTFRKRNADGETGFFIREKHLEELNKKHPPRFSVATSTAPRTSADLVAELRQSPLGGIIDQLLANNRVVLHDTVREIGPNVPAGVQGFTESDGSIHLVAEHLRPGTASSVLLHEAFHVGAQSLLGDAQWQRLNKRLGALYRQAQRSEGKLNEFWRQAYGRVEHAQRMGDRMSEAIAIEEFGAYAIENYERAPRTLKKWVDDLIGAIKAWLLRRFDVQLGDVTPAQLRALALAALRASAERPAVNIPSRALGGMALNEAPLSVGETIDVDGVSRPTTNSNGQPIAATEEGIRNFWRWFGDSKVVDEQGRPLVVYHGTKGDFAEFQLGRADRRDGGWFGDGFYLTASQDLASSYAMRERDYSLTDRPANVMPVYVRMSNPYRINLGELSYDEGSNFTKKYGGNEGFRKWLADNGYDGVIGYRDPEIAGQGAEFWEVVVFDPAQIKSAIGNRGTFDPANPDIRYSIKPSEHFKDLTDEQKRFLDKIGPERLPQRLSDRWRQLTDNLGLRIRQAGVDRYAALLRNDQAIYGEDTLEGSIASSSWVLARMSHSAGGALTAMLNHGRIYLDPKEKVIDVREGTEGLRSVFQSLGTPQEIDRFMAWVAANRSKKLLGEGRENLFTPEEVDAGIKLSAGKLEDGRARPVVYQQAWEKFKQYRDDVLGIAEQAGIITPEQRQTWSEEFYVPFYRVLDDDTVGGPSSSSGLSRQQAYKRLKGGKQNLNDLLENTLLNFHHLIQASLKNQAAQQAVENAMELGIAEPTTESKRDKKLSTWVMVNGEKRWYNVHDPLTFKAISALAHPGYNHPLMKAGRAFKRLFTSLTTVTPQFVIANTLRDSLSAMATSPTSGVPFENALKGAAVYGNEYNRARMIASGGSFSFGHVYGQNPDDIKASLKGTLREGRLLSDPGLIPGALRNAWRKWQNVTDFAENVNRAGIWERNLEQGKLKAAFEARDLMDFSAHGDALIVRLLIDLVPFLNARIQGLDKLYRSGFKPGAKVIAGTATAADRKSFARFAAVTGALSLLSMLLYLRNWDDEEYRKLEDWQRDTYWFIRFGDNAFFIPKPFEVGAIATLAERGLEQFMDPTVAGKKFGERLWHMLTDTFAFDMPQIVKPVYELAANRDTFTGRPIEDIGMQRLSPSQRFRPDTSRLAEVISRGMEAVVGDAALSPVQIDHLIAGYLGQVGAGTVATADVLWRRAMGEQLPARRWSEYQPIRRFYRDLGVPAPYTRYSTDFYNALKEADRAYANVQHLLKYQEYERAAALEEKESDKLAMRKQLNKVARDLSKINAQMRQIQVDKTMNSEQKRYELDRLRELRNMITESVGKVLEEERARKGAAERPSARP